ncbi:hypothetical protein Droror1_Dr00001313 [Drosera rotundifolia]
MTSKPFKFGEFVSEGKETMEAPLQISELTYEEGSATLAIENSVMRPPRSPMSTDSSHRISMTTDSLHAKDTAYSRSMKGDDRPDAVSDGNGKESCSSSAPVVSTKSSMKHLNSDAEFMSNLQSSTMENSVQDSEATMNSRKWGMTVGLEPIGDVFAVAEDLDVQTDGYDPSFLSVLETPHEKLVRTMSTRSADSVALWGFTCIRGGRPEMEDAVAVMPSFQKVPIKMFVKDTELDVGRTLSQTMHFYGVYDGHGGAEVANYCRDHLHFAMANEIESLKGEFHKGHSGHWEEELEKCFMRCFLKADAEVGMVRRGDAGTDNGESEADLEPIAPETVGSTAVVAVVCSTHIMVANSGDSRAVLSRGKTPMPLSIDHKPNRVDELERIESGGGKVIQWNGFRVYGVLAMSRSIGDRYLKPWIIPDPEVMCVPRTKEDECIILASDGLWDVMTKEEVCDAARRRILLWHKKNGTVSETSGKGADPAAQAAAEYLTKLALQKGSNDNISVIVVDLKPHRRLRTKS